MKYMSFIFLILILIGLSPAVAFASFSLFDSGGEIWYGYNGTPVSVDFEVYDCTSASTLHTDNASMVGQANPYDLYGHAQLTGYGVTSGHDTVISANDNLGDVVYHSFVAPDFTTDTGLDLTCSGGGGGATTTATTTPLSTEETLYIDMIFLFFISLFGWSVLFSPFNRTV